MTRHRSTDISANLLDLARQGSSTALEDLWECCVPIIESEIRAQRGINRTDADDLAQEAALLLLDLVGSAAPPANPAPDFAERFARSLHWRIHSYLRRERRRHRREVPGEVEKLEQALAKRAAGASQAGPSGRALQRAIAQLSPRQRAVIVGLYEREATVATLAAEEHVSPQAITALHRRALLSLRRLLDPAT